VCVCVCECVCVCHCQVAARGLIVAWSVGEATIFFLRNRGYQLYIHLHISYFKLELDIRSQMECRSIECIGAYN
jgi:hypothetical protein